MLKQVLKRSTYPYLEISLDDLSRNVNILRARLKRPSTGIIGVVKAGAYGHGSVQVSKHLKSIGVERLAVATLEEAVLLRKNNVHGPLHLLGNTRPWQIETCLDHNIMPTVCTPDTIKAVAAARSRNPGNDENSRTRPEGAVTINIDTGMSRDGCQPEEFHRLFELCENNGVAVDTVSTHFADSWYNKDFTEQQYSLFLETVKPVRSKDLKLHVANSGAILRGIGTDLDFVRPGVALYGLPVDKVTPDFTVFGFKPIAKIKGSPNLVKLLPSGRSVGYGLTYTAEKDEWIATFPVGYGHGFWQPFSDSGLMTSPVIIQDSTGQKCPVVGSVSSDALTVKLPSRPDDNETFTLMTNDYDSSTSAAGYAETLGTDSVGFCMRLSTRMSKVYKKTGSDPIVVQALSAVAY